MARRRCELRLAVTGLDLGQGRTHERFDDGFKLEKLLPPGQAQQLQPFRIEAAAMPPVHLRQQPFLAAEVVADEGPVHAGCRGDRPHRDVGVAVVGEQPLRRGDQLVRRIGGSCRRFRRRALRDDAVFTALSIQEASRCDVRRATCHVRGGLTPFPEVSARRTWHVARTGGLCTVVQAGAIMRR